MPSQEQFWPECLSTFERELSAQQFNTWIKPLKCESDDETLRLIAPNRFAIQFVKDRFLTRIEELAVEYFGRPVSVGLALAQAESKGASNGTTDATSPKAPATAKATAFKQIGASNETTRLIPTYTFDNLVTGKANQLARAAAMQIAENPGVAYNPLFVYGGSGLGKTHLVHAIGNLVHHQNPQARIRYIHAERYVSDVVKAYQHKAFDEFKRYYHSLDLLLIDDIQFISGKSRTQEEFFYAFNALIEANKQIIITCDTFPKEIKEMDDRLVSRFGWGLTVAIEPPELEMRVAILLKKAEQENFKLDDNVAFFIARHIRSNVRDLEGALKRVLAYSRFTGNPVTMDLVKDALKDVLAVENRLVSIENIQKVVADFYKVKVADMHSKKRSRNIARPRQIAMALAKELTQMSLPAIGEAFGGRDHTTVLHACRTIADFRESDMQLKHDFQVLMQMIKG
ncbi:chromosomal replication initiator protein DnaA [Chitinivorax sp. B]|uniref:chromosomal replication initiator protein DnaA n=1 Tax=Chitinivorax sp. B TaxID=2502235 RepID=UPI0010F98FBC|nr:chromosomal replication initiator protein DnaA [Chitinivorax sp. B]